MPAEPIKDHDQTVSPTRRAAELRVGESQRLLKTRLTISFVALICFILLLFTLLHFAEKLVGLGLWQGFYYPVLIFMGLSAGSAIAAVRESQATYTGKLFDGTLRLKGPVVVAAIVVVGGYFFGPKPTTFPLTVYVHGEAGPQDIVLQKNGSVSLKLGPNIETAPIEKNGQAFFPAVPSDFRGQQVQAWVESDDYESPSPNAKIEGISLDLQVKKKIKRFKLAGNIFDEATRNPMSGVRVILTTYSKETQTNADGRFNFDFEVEAGGQQRVNLIAQKTGYQTLSLSPTLGDTGLNFYLKRD